MTRRSGRRPAPLGAFDIARALEFALEWDSVSARVEINSPDEMMISDYGRKMDSHTIDRRTLLKFGASAAAGMILPGYTGTRAYQTPAPRASSVILPKVQVSNDRVIRSVA